MMRSASTRPRTGESNFESASYHMNNSRFEGDRYLGRLLDLYLQLYTSPATAANLACGNIIIFNDFCGLRQYRV